MNHPIAIELKFAVPRAARKPLMQEMGRGAALGHQTLVARHLDTPDGRLARDSLAWCMRCENGRWVQRLETARRHLQESFAHDVVRSDSSPDAAAHAGTPAGDRLLSLLRRAQADGVVPMVCAQTDVRRSVRRMRLRGAVVEVAFDEGHLLAAGTSQRLLEVEFELKSGSSAAMWGLAARWQERFGLVYDPRRTAARGVRLADGSPHPAVRKAAVPPYRRGATTAEAFGVVVDECLAQITHNALGLSSGDPACRVEHVHQLRVGIRRLRSALRSFEGWFCMPPPALLDDTRALFAALGQSRDSDVLCSGVTAELARAGAPPLRLPPLATGPTVSATQQAARAQKIGLAWIAWRSGGQMQPAGAQNTWQTGATRPTAAPAVTVSAVALPEGATRPAAALGLEATALAQLQAAPAPLKPHEFRHGAEKRLRKWHARIASGAADFDSLDEAALHTLRKRVKRQRYAVEFFLPLLRARQATRYLRALTELQDRMGKLNDLFVARARYQASSASGGAAVSAAVWFALGWLAAQIAQARTRTKPALVKLAQTDPPET